MALLLTPAGARAQTPPRLQGQITDLSRDRLLSGGESRITAALQELQSEHDVQLFVLFVQSANERPITDYADDVARQNSLGWNNALLVVALDDRSFAIWRDAASLEEKLTDNELGNVLSGRVRPALQRGDYVGAVVDGTQGINSAVGGSGGIGIGGGAMPIIILVVVIVGGWLVWRAFSGKQQAQRTAAKERKATEQLANQANSVLISADEELRNARQEVGFAEAEFSEADVAPYRDAVKAASDELTAAFLLRQQADEDEQEEAARRKILQEVIDRAQRVQASLEEQERRLQELRDLERTAPEVLAALPGQVDALEGRLPQAERTLTGLTQRYAERAWAAVKNNVDAARGVLAPTRAAVAEGQQLLAANDRAGAVRQMRLAQQALTEGDRLLDAIDHLAESIRQAEMAAPGQHAAAAADAHSARAALAGRGQTEMEARLAQAEAALQQAQRELSAAQPDPLLALRLIGEADAAADAILAEVKQEAERREREQRVLVGQLQSAQAEYERAQDFISARRRLIGSSARTRLAEARRHLDRAVELSGSDPGTALAEARQAQQLAEDAYRRADSDVDAATPYGGGWGGPMVGGPVIFPFPFPVPTGGGRRRGGGGFGGGFGGGRSVGGSFGGFRGGGGGGGRSVGGRW